MPFVGTALLENLPLMIEHDAFDLRLNLKPLRGAGEAIDNGFERFLADCSRLGLACVLRLKNRGRFSELCFLAGLTFFDRFDFVPRHFQPQRELGLQRSGIVFAQRSGFEQLALVKLGDRWVLLDLYVKIGLGE